MAKQCLRNLYLVVLVFVLAACAVTPRQPTPTWGAVECQCEGTAHAWIDENADGIWDEGETPLSGVKIKAYGGNIGLVDAVTDVQGRVSLFTAYWPVYGQSCTNFWKEEETRGRQVEVRAETPSGYRPTTASRISVPASYRLPSGTLRFGFVPIALTETSMPSSTATSTPRVMSFEKNCWTGGVYAWIDENANGVWDEGETALPGVTLYLTGPGVSNTGVSNEEGEVFLFACWTVRFKPGTQPGRWVPIDPDPEGELVVYPRVPPGYRLTTVPRRPTIDGGPLQFGFVPDVPTPTPHGGG